MKKITYRVGANRYVMLAGEPAEVSQEVNALFNHGFIAGHGNIPKGIPEDYNPEKHAAVEVHGQSKNFLPALRSRMESVLLAPIARLCLPNRDARKIRQSAQFRQTVEEATQVLLSTYESEEIERDAPGQQTHNLQSGSSFATLAEKFIELTSFDDEKLEDETYENLPLAEKFRLAMNPSKKMVASSVSVIEMPAKPKRVTAGMTAIHFLLEK